jgi:hypothetical protein
MQKLENDCHGNKQWQNDFQAVAGINLEISWTDRVINEEVLQRVKERGTSYIKRTGDKCIGHFLRNSCLLKHVGDGEIDGRIEVKGR